MSKNKKKHLVEPPKRRIRISQCMIVKNEERNIERALGWAKDIAFEQIVVDTGSTDATVEIAKKMGAKVYHFEWIDDFAAAKNFAIEQANGNWIAFLDADEYFSAEDAKELTVLLREIEDNPDREHYQGVTCSWVQLDDEGKAFAVLKQERVFRNDPGIRYAGRIHERLTLTKYNVEDLNLRIMHDGYSKSSFSIAGKDTRNIRILRAELEREPDNAEIMVYLADALKTSMSEADEKEAEGYYRRALDSGSEIHPLVKKLAYDFLIPYYLRNENNREDAARLCREAIEVYPEYIDFSYYSGLIKNSTGDFSGAYDDLLRCEQIMQKTEVPLTRFLLADPEPLYRQLEISKRGLGDMRNDSISTSDNKRGGVTSVRLSQCMIVKNEEKNIERALSWARDIAFEQIVVDTGSSDKTVEIARRMGAQVYHFEWADDFSAAKNYAIEQASGDWIAFLDADEYFDTADANKIINILEACDKKTKIEKEIHLISCPMVQLGDDNMPFGTNTQARLFRNLPQIRYKGRIHEALTFESENAFHDDTIKIYHTGYSESAAKEKGKFERNVSMLRTELNENPDDIKIKGYLAEALSNSSETEHQEEAEQIFREVLVSREAYEKHKKNAYLFIINRLCEKHNSSDANPDLFNEAAKMCEEAGKELLDDVDFEYLTAAVLINKGDYISALERIKGCDDKLARDDAGSFQLSNKEWTMRIFCKLSVLGKSYTAVSKMISDLTMILKTNKYINRIVIVYIFIFMKYNVSNNEIIELLQKLYDFGSIKDKLFIVRVAKEGSAYEIAKAVMGMITDQERRWMSGEKSSN